MAATNHLELLKLKDEAEISFIIEKTVGKLLKTQNIFEDDSFLDPSEALKIKIEMIKNLNIWKFYLTVWFTMFRLACPDHNWHFYIITRQFKYNIMESKSSSG